MLFFLIFFLAMADKISFYDIGGYRENIRRYKDGIEQLTDIQTMIKVPFFFLSSSILLWNF